MKLLSQMWISVGLGLLVSADTASTGFTASLVDVGLG